ncbi:hypothetical protein HDU67_010210 [Dinochytrium kinnereticum]|nr:hypothetical protein HDU67_010210 [Dinochytrium kinnereticum]
MSSTTTTTDIIDNSSNLWSALEALSSLKKADGLYAARAGGGGGGDVEEEDAEGELSFEGRGIAEDVFGRLRPRVMGIALHYARKWVVLVCG